ncbi:GntR family transcriptional regulator [Rhodococcus sp. NPDC127530]|uniref:GntR family transcriptional regulator n=1 Tax=unclassified Rhodococcus (in: high G+C Gram-positive bacteria) TaxID=192944 RepID=UPI00362801AF
MPRADVLCEETSGNAPTVALQPQPVQTTATSIPGTAPSTSHPKLRSLSYSYFPDWSLERRTGITRTRRCPPHRRRCPLPSSPTDTGRSARGPATTRCFNIPARGDGECERHGDGRDNEQPAAAGAVPDSDLRPEQVAKEIRRSNLSGKILPEQTFSLREISGQLGVSFIPVREALKELEAQGLVVTGNSAIVAPLSHDDLHGIYRLRRQLEPEIAGRACKLLDDADLRRLDAYVAMFGDESLDIDDIYQAHHAFHYELLRHAATAWDLRVLDGLWHTPNGISAWRSRAAKPNRTNTSGGDTRMRTSSPSCAPAT